MVEATRNSGGAYTLVLSDIAFDVYILEITKQQINYDVKGRIIEIIEPECVTDLKDYKFFSFDGFTKAMFIATDRASQTEETKFDFFNMDFQHLPFTNGHPNAEILPARPAEFERMRKLADKLSKGIPQARIDFYEINGKVYFGEITFFHWSGMVSFNPEEWDKKFGDWITLPK